MMAEYIERERARHECKYFFKGDEKAREDCESLLCDLPAADVAPVRRGEWEETDWVEPDGHGFGMIRFPNEGFRCSRCVNVFRKELLWKKNYCPNCGAKMKVPNDD